jgi:hypothetical protein
LTGAGSFARTTCDYEYEGLDTGRKPAVTRELVVRNLPTGWKRIDVSAPAKDGD